MSSQGMAVSNYKADEKEATRNRKKLMALIKRPENTVCADCPQKRKLHPKRSRQILPFFASARRARACERAIYSALCFVVVLARGGRICACHFALSPHFACGPPNSLYYVLSRSESQSRRTRGRRSTSASSSASSAPASTATSAPISPRYARPPNKTRVLHPSLSLSL